MTDQNLGKVVSKVAAADLSSNQYRIQKLDSDGKLADVAASTDVPYGVLQNTPVTNEAASVAVVGGGGSAKLELGEVVDEAALVSFDADGKAVAAAAGSYTIGICETGGNTGDLGKVLLNNLIIKA